MNFSQKFKAAFVASALLLAPISAHAATTIGAIGVSASIPDLGVGHEVGNLIDQSGISDNYVNLATRFRPFVNSTTLTGDPSQATGTGWASTTGNIFPAHIDFTFDRSYLLTAVGIWNDTDTQALGDFEVFSATDATFSTLASLGTFTAAVQALGTVGQRFDFVDDAFTQYIRITGSPVIDGNGLLNIGEFVFATPVPVPAALPLFLSAIGGFGLISRRRRKAA